MVNAFLTKIRALSEKKIIIYGLINLVATTIIATFSQTHFDRIIMPHQSYTPIAFYIPLTEILITVVTFSLILWGAAIYWSDTSVSLFRMINRQLFARIPLALPPLFFLSPKVKAFLHDLTTWWTGDGSQPLINASSIIVAIALLLTTLSAIYLFIRLSFEGFIQTGNLGKKRVKVTYIGALLLGEMICHPIIVKLFIA